MPGLGGRPWSEWIAQYGRSHEHPVNRLCHTIGIPLIALSIPLFLAALVVPGLWRPALGLFLVGWAFQFVGHAWEGHKPAFVDDLVGLVIGPLFVTVEVLFLLGLRKSLQQRIEARVGKVRHGSSHSQASQA